MHILRFVGAVGANGFVGKNIANENCSIGAAHFDVFGKIK